MLVECGGSSRGVDNENEAERGAGRRRVHSGDVAFCDERQEVFHHVLRVNYLNISTARTLGEIPHSLKPRAVHNVSP
jgi:hypothetical protein